MSLVPKTHAAAFTMGGGAGSYHNCAMLAPRSGLKPIRAEPSMQFHGELSRYQYKHKARMAPVGYRRLPLLYHAPVLSSLCPMDRHLSVWETRRGGTCQLPRVEYINSTASPVHFLACCPMVLLHDVPPLRFLAYTAEAEQGPQNKARRSLSFSLVSEPK